MKLTNKQLRQIIKEELEYVMGEGLGDVIGPGTDISREVPFGAIQTMPEVLPLAQGDDKNYMTISRYSGGEELTTIFAKDNGKVYASRKLTTQELNQAEKVLMDAGFRPNIGQNVHGEEGRYFGPSDENTRYTG